MRKKSLKTKMLVLILSTSLFIYVLAIGYISITFKQTAMQNARDLADAEAKESANLVKAILNGHFGVARGMAQAFAGYKDLPEQQRIKFYTNILRNVLEANPEYIAVFNQWELNAINPEHKKPYGRVRKVFYKEGNRISFITDTLDLEGDDTTGIYYYVKSTGREIITRPYYYHYNREQTIPEVEALDDLAILEATIIIPILEDGLVVGMTGMDIPLEHFQPIVEEVKPFPQAYTFLVSNNGRVVAHPDKNLIYQTLEECFPVDQGIFNLTSKIGNGEKFSYISEDPTFMYSSYVSFIPLSIGNTNTPWSLGIVVPVNVIVKEANRAFYISVGAGIIGLIILSIIVWFISHNITRPLIKTTQMLRHLSLGNLRNASRLVITTNDEVGEMTRSANTLLDGMNHTADFANQIGEGNLDARYELLSENDILGHSLIEMRNRLKKSREEIQKQSEKLRSINAELEKLSIVASETDNAIIIMDPEGNVEWLNEGFTKLYGWTTDELVRDLGKNLKDFSTNKDISTIIKRCRESKRSMVYVSLDYNKSGERIWAQTTLTPVLDRDGEVIKLVTIDSDISKIKEAESQISRQRDDLQELNAAKDKFFSIIAHDLKNPFSVLLSVTEALHEGFSGLSDVEKSRSIQKIHQSANLLYNLLDNLLQWSMSQTGRIKYEPEKMDLGTVVVSTVSILRLKAESKKIRLQSEIPQKTYVMADVDMVKTVVRNLMVNAIKFNKEGGHVRAYSRQQKEFLEVSIEDTGIGMSDEDVKKLFRIDVKNKTIGESKEKGTGLGLILSKEYIEKNGGTIRVESQLGTGSRFIFTLPLSID
jgi:PAS domain S-box-containing protein